MRDQATPTAVATPSPVTAAALPTHNLGYPRIGERRELKRALEAFWAGRLTEVQLHAEAARLRASHWQKQRDAGIDLIPSNDFSYYDGMLDAAVLVGAVPARFGGRPAADGAVVDTATYFRMARGTEANANTAADAGATGHGGGASCGHHPPAVALEMTKWFDTNYHYLVPELTPDMTFSLASDKPFDEFAEALVLGVKTKPVLVGPVTFLLLSKVHGAEPSFDPLSLLDGLVAVYAQVLGRLAQQGAEWVQFDEPAFALDLTSDQLLAMTRAYGRLASVAPGLRLMVATYFGELRANLAVFARLPVAGLHYDAVRGDGEAELDALLAQLSSPSEKVLSLGVVDGRNVWRNDFRRSLALLRRAVARLGRERLFVAPSCSLLFSPVTLAHETRLDAELKSWLAFADEKLTEVAQLARLATTSPIGGHGAEENAAFVENQRTVAARRSSPRIHDADVQARLAAVQPEDHARASAFPERKRRQQARLGLPLLPTTTIGSFPQTAEVRAARARFRRGELSQADYEAFLRAETRRCVEWQERVGLDVLVHGEFERTDMVEHFGENLAGFAFSENGWVQSYGSRCVKPPILFGDVARPAPMTVAWSEYARALTTKPVKAMLTGPVTLLQWSFVRDDQPRALTAQQLALALRDEVTDLEAAGLGVIQVDEPALREGLPLRRAEREGYLAWAVDAFRLCTAGVRDDTQVHTHMCYGEFHDVMEAIAALDADVISVETSRSQMELLEAFVGFRYPADIGPGVWDVHSPRVPSVEEMETLLRRALTVLSPEQVWVNPDCGLKTRAWAEVAPALENLVAAARRLRGAARGTLTSSPSSPPGSLGA